MTDHDERLTLEGVRETFRQESQELLDLAEQALLALEDTPSDAPLVDEVFRVAHSLKGNASAVGFDHIARLAHAFEDVLTLMRERRLAATADLTEVLLGAVDALRGAVRDAAAGATELSARQREVLAQLGGHELLEAAVGPTAEADQDEPSVPRLPQPARSRTIRVGLEKLDALMNLVAEIVIARGRVGELLRSTEGTGRAEVLDAHQTADLLYQELQERVMRLRTVPLGPLFREYFRTARDAASAGNKQVKLIVEGEDVEVDAAVVEHLRDPLMHLVRNAVHHGIEAPAERSAARKDAHGTVTLRAWRDAGSIVVEVADDGTGMDFDKIRRRARSLGLLTMDGEVADEQIAAVVFEPGFSTSDAVTDMSGRGVGLDVVRRNVESIRGTVHIDSGASGTTVSMRLPLMVAIIDGFRVGVAGETYVLPLDSVRECVEMPTVTTSDGCGAGLLDIRGKPTPYLDLAYTFRLEGERPVRRSVVVVHHDGVEAGLEVDHLFGEAQTVVKPLGKLFDGVSGLAGTAILGTGKVAFVLDVPSLLRMALHRTKSDEGGRS
jgi:two-component system chemotaxis sensor kinase CheA